MGGRRGRAAAVAILAAGGVLAAACGAGGGTGSPGEVAGGRIAVEHSALGDRPLALNGVAAAVDDAVVVLASETSESEAGVALRSDDEGRTWSTTATGLADAVDGVSHLEFELPFDPQLLVAGDWLVATRTVSDDGGALAYPAPPSGGSVPRQAVVVSADRGRTWEPVDVPHPEGGGALVLSAAEIDGRLHLGGTERRPGEGADPAVSPYGAAMWVRADDGALAPVPAPGPGGTGTEVVRDLAVLAGRVVAMVGVGPAPGEHRACCFADLATTAWERDDDRSWSPMRGLHVPRNTMSSLREEGGSLVMATWQRRLVLEPGADGWVDRPLPDDVFPDADVVVLPDGGAAVTWTEELGDDLWAYVGRIVDGSADTVLLYEDECGADRHTFVHRPVLLGSTVVATAGACAPDDGGGDDPALAWSADGGATWEVDLIGPAHVDDLDLAYDGGRLLVIEGGAGPDDDVLLAFATEAHELSDSGDLLDGIPPRSSSVIRFRAS
jgi:hypothetical protein